MIQEGQLSVTGESMCRKYWPVHVAQSVGHLTLKSGVPGSIPGLATYFVSPSSFSRRAVVSYWRKYVHKVWLTAEEV